MKKTILVIILFFVFSISVVALNETLPDVINGFKETMSKDKQTDVKLAEEITLDDDTFNKLALFFAKNDIDDKTQEYIINLIKKGYNVNYVIIAAEFWQKTDYDCYLIEQILSKIPKETEELRDIQVSGIFNEISNNISGVLTIDEGKKYLEAGMSLSELYTANEISKKGVCDIHEILDKTCQDGTMNGVIVEVYSKAKRDKYDFSGINSEDLKKIKNPNDLISAVKLSKLKNKKVKDIIVDKSEGLENDYFNEVNKRNIETKNKLTKDFKVKRGAER